MRFSKCTIDSSAYVNENIVCMHLFQYFMHFELEFKYKCEYFDGHASDICISMCLSMRELKVYKID